MPLSFSLILSGLTTLQMTRITSVVPTAIGQTAVESRNSVGYPSVSSLGVNPLNLAIDVTLNQGEFSLFEEFIYEQERDGNRGNIIFRNQYHPINSRWSTIGNRTQVGSAITTHAAVDQYYVEYPCLLILPSDYWEPQGRNSQGLWYAVKFEVEELLA